MIYSEKGQNKVFTIITGVNSNETAIPNPGRRVKSLRHLESSKSRGTVSRLQFGQLNGKPAV